MEFYCGWPESCTADGVSVKYEGNLEHRIVYDFVLHVILPSNYSHIYFSFFVGFSITSNLVGGVASSPDFLCHRFLYGGRS